MHNEGYGTWFVCVCVFYSLTTRYLSYNMMYFQGQRTIEKVLNLAFSLKTLCFEIMAFLQLFIFLSLGTLCLCVSVTTFSTTLFSGAWRTFQIWLFYKDTSFESYDAFSL